MAAIEYKKPGTEELKTIFELYCSVGWWDREQDDPAVLGAALSGSLAVLCAYDGALLIGCARALGDGVSDAFIQDVAVFPEYRGRGVGGELVRRLAAALEACGIDWIGLVGVPGTEKFYRGLGFEPLAGHTPYRKKK